MVLLIIIITFFFTYFFFFFLSTSTLILRKYVPTSIISILNKDVLVLFKHIQFY